MYALLDFSDKYCQRIRLISFLPSLFIYCNELIYDDMTSYIPGNDQIKTYAKLALRFWSIGSMHLSWRNPCWIINHVLFVQPYLINFAHFFFVSVTIVFCLLDEKTKQSKSRLKSEFCCRLRFYVDYPECAQSCNLSLLQTEWDCFFIFFHLLSPFKKLEKTWSLRFVHMKKRLVWRKHVKEQQVKKKREE